MSPPGIRPTALIDFRSPDDGVAPLRLAFGAPRERLRATSLDEVAPLLARVDALARAGPGAWATSATRRRARSTRRSRRTRRPIPTRPLAAFAVYDAPLADAVRVRARRRRHRALDGRPAARRVRRDHRRDPARHRRRRGLPGQRHRAAGRHAAGRRARAVRRAAPRAAQRVCGVPGLRHRRAHPTTASCPSRPSCSSTGATTACSRAR